MKKHYREENDCLNCGTTLDGKYCHNCGQENLQIKESFGHMMNHAISDYFHFDHQFFHTLKPLLFKPGYLTNEYMAGRRVQYLHPIKMYIFISVVYFFFLFQNKTETVNIAVKPVVAEKTIDSTKKAVTNSRIIDSGKKKNAGKVAAKQKVDHYGLVTVNESDDEAGKPNGWFHPATNDLSYSQYLINQARLPVQDRDGLFKRLWNKKAFEYNIKYGNMAREIFLEELQHNIPKMMFILLPLLALILRVMFYKSKKFYVEHLIYTFHLHCFLFLFLGLLINIQILTPGSWSPVMEWIKAVATFYIIWYIYRSLRVVYHRTRFRTVTKIIGMGLMYFIAFMLCFSIVLVFTTFI